MKGQFTAHEQMPSLFTWRAQAIQVLRAEGERVLAALRAEEQISRQQSQA